MSKSTDAGMQEEGQMRLYVDRISKKIHNAIILNQRQFAVVFKKHGCYARSFQFIGLDEKTLKLFHSKVIRKL